MYLKDRDLQPFLPMKLADFGHPKLKEHLEGVIAIMRISNNWDTFKRRMDIAYPKQGTTIPINLDNED